MLPFHCISAAVTGLAMCVRQPLIATCSMDRTVHLWNYFDRTCELSKSFTEEAYSIAIHPTGLQVRAGAWPPRPPACSLQRGLQMIRLLIEASGL